MIKSGDLQERITDLHERIMLFEELEAYFSGAHARPEDEIRRKKLLRQIVQAKGQASAEFKALGKNRMKAA